MFLKPLLRQPRASHSLVNQRNGRVLARRLVGSFDSSSRRTGLLKHHEFPPGHAMLIAPSNAVHTFFMRFPIDLAFVTRDGLVVKTCEAVAPWRVAGAWRAYAVIELPAGTLAGSETVRGDRVAIVAAPEDLVPTRQTSTNPQD